MSGASNAVAATPADSIFTRLAAAGLLPDIVPALPPDATLSERSRVSPSDRGKVPGQAKADGTWAGFRAWQLHQATAADIAEWSSPHWSGAGACVICRRVVPIDIDVTDAALAEKIEHAAIDILGPAPCRIGNAPKRLLTYRLPDGVLIGKVALALPTGGADAKVEILGHVQQFIAYGIHPKTMRPYAWPHGDLINTTFAGLTVAPLDKLNAFLARVAEMTGATDCPTVAPATAASKKPAVFAEYVENFNASADAAITAEWLCKSAPIAVHGQAGYDATCAVVQTCLDRVGPERAWNLMREHWTPRCEYPWDEFELRDKIESLAASRQTPIGSRALQFKPTAEAQQRTFDAFDDEIAAIVAPEAHALAARERLRAAGFEFCGDIKLRDAPIYLVKDWWQYRSLVTIGGQPGAGKTALMTELAFDVMTGTYWHGHRTTKGAVIFLAMENADDTRLRYLAAKKARGLEGVDLPGVIYPDVIDLGTGGAVNAEKIVDRARDVTAAVGLPVALFIIDTKRRATPGLKENDATEQGLFIAALDTIKNATGACVMFSHHTGEDEERLSGSRMIQASVDTEAFAIKSSDSAGALSIPKKNRGGPVGMKAGYSLHPIAIGAQAIEGVAEPETVWSVYAAPTDIPPTRPQAKPKGRHGASTAADKVTRLIADMTRGGAPVTFDAARTEFRTRYYPGDAGGDAKDMHKSAEAFRAGLADATYDFRVQVIGDALTVPPSAVLVRSAGGASGEGPRKGKH